MRTASRRGSPRREVADALSGVGEALVDSPLKLPPVRHPCPPRRGGGPARSVGRPAGDRRLSASALPARPGSACGIGPMGAVRALGRASGLPTAPDSAFFLGHGNAAGVQCGFSRAVRGPGRRGQRSSGKSQVILHPERPAEEAPPMLAIVLASASIGLALADEPPPGPTAEVIRAGVSRALPLLEKGSAGYVAQRDCFSCHHQAVPSSRSTWPADVAFRSRRRQPGRTDRTDALRSLLRTRHPTRRARVRVGG